MKMNRTQYNPSLPWKRSVFSFHWNHRAISSILFEMSKLLPKLINSTAETNTGTENLLSEGVDVTGKIKMFKNTLNIDMSKDKMVEPRV
jgi:hypothetical protein